MINFIVPFDNAVTTFGKLSIRRTKHAHYPCLELPNCRLDFHFIIFRYLLVPRSNFTSSTRATKSNSELYRTPLFAWTFIYCREQSSCIPWNISGMISSGISSTTLHSISLKQKRIIVERFTWCKSQEDAGTVGTSEPT